MAASGLSKNEPPIDDKGRAVLRQHALEALRLELQPWWKAVADGSTKDLPDIMLGLSRWKQDPDLASIRDPKALEKLPPTERQGFETFWREVDSLLEKLDKRA